MKESTFIHQAGLAIVSLGLATLFAVPITGDAAAAPRLRIQRWATATHIYWIRAITPDRVAVSYFNGGASGLDVVDGSGQIVRREWPLPAGTHCAAVYPIGRLFLRQEGSDWNPQVPAAIRPDGSAIVLTGDPVSPLMSIGPAAPDGRAFGQIAFSASRPSWVNGLEAQPDGKILVWGDLKLADGSSANLIRINLDEILDLNFQSHVGRLGFVRNVRSSPDGTIFVETVDADASQFHREWARLNSDGSVQSSIALTVPAGPGLEIAAMLDDGSVVLSVDGGQQLLHIFTDGSSRMRDGIGFWSDFWFVSDLVPLAGGQLIVRQRAGCDGGGCFVQDWLKILPNDMSDGVSMVAWVSHAPNYYGVPILLADGLRPEATYLVEASTDFSEWQQMDFARSADRTSFFVRDFEALDLNLKSRFYRVREP